MIIPKIFHRIWIGSKVPDHLLRYGDSWIKHHPGWEMRLWTDENIPKSRYPDLIEKSKYWSSRSDIYRYEILLAQGGIYLDMDFECLKPLDPLIEKLEAFTAYQLTDPVTDGAIANGFFGVTPGHPLMRDLVEGIPKQYKFDDRLNVGPPYFTQVVRRHPKVKVFLKNYFYPYLWNEHEKRNNKFPHAYAIHYWNSHFYEDLVGKEGKKN